MGEVDRDRAALNAQFQTTNDELRASHRAITEQLAQIKQRDRPNGPRPPARNQPDLDSDADSTDDTKPVNLNDRTGPEMDEAENGGSKEEMTQTGREAGTEKRRNRG